MKIPSETAIRLEATTMGFRKWREKDYYPDEKLLQMLIQDEYTSLKAFYEAFERNEQIKRQAV